MDSHEERERPTPADWSEAVDRGLDDIAAGRTVTAEALLSELRARNDRMDAAIGRKKTTDAA